MFHPQPFNELSFLICSDAHTRGWEWEEGMGWEILAGGENRFSGGRCIRGCKNVGTHEDGRGTRIRGIRGGMGYLRDLGQILTPVYRMHHLDLFCRLIPIKSL